MKRYENKELDCRNNQAKKKKPVKDEDEKESMRGWRKVG